MSGFFFFFGVLHVMVVFLSFFFQPFETESISFMTSMHHGHPLDGHLSAAKRRKKGRDIDGAFPKSKKKKSDVLFLFSGNYDER